MDPYPQRALLRGLETPLFELMSSSATPKQWEEWLWVLLEHAAACGNLCLVKRLLEAGAFGEAGWKGCRGRALLSAVVMGGNTDVVITLIKAGAGPGVGVITDSPRSPLYLAIRSGHEGAARQILAAGADANFEDPDDFCRPLHAAAEGGHDGLVADLLSAGASPSLSSGDGKTPLHIAAESGHDKIVSLLLNTTSDKNAEDEEFRFSPPIPSYCDGHLSGVEFLVLSDVDPNVRTLYGDDSALDLATQQGHVDVLKALVKNGADVNGVNTNGYTALHTVRGRTGAGVVCVLVDAGAHVDAMSDNMETPLLCAAGKASSADVVLALLLRGANANKADVSGDTPLHIACMARQEGMAKVVDLLLRWGASETAIDDGGRTPANMLLFDNRAMCSADEVERTRVFLGRAPADRSWLRWFWPIALLSRVAGISSATERGGELAPSDGKGGGGKESGAGEGEMLAKRYGDHAARTGFGESLPRDGGVSVKKG